MREAGAFIVGKTVTTELATFVPPETRNPRDLTRTPGGSSSGSAAAVAAGHVDIAIGTQTAGSIIRPAAYCGVYGFKPSFGLVPTDGVLVQRPSFDTVGVFARSLEHIDAWFGAFAPRPPDSAFSTTVHAPKRNLKIAVLSPLPTTIEPEYEAWIFDVSRCWLAAGHELYSLSGPGVVADLCKAHSLVQQAESARAFDQLGRLHDRALVDYVQAGLAIAKGSIDAARAEIGCWQEWFEGSANSFDLFVSPGTTGRAPNGLSFTGDPVMCRLASALGAPALAMPTSAVSFGMCRLASALGAPALAMPTSAVSFGTRSTPTASSEPVWSLQLVAASGADTSLIGSAKKLRKHSNDNSCS
ncbi:MAG: hypothetical protein LW865_08635 [Betaproteobacteria bacterium]|jgi:Asp-tRNA(Asn)/Glu-tRNA(Gln) amidotransferase A subunit family amidase|nr:hypothetical protein [Betaproteobacteria bacterium]